MKAYYSIVADILQEARPATILDLPSGDGWLQREVAGHQAVYDGIDLYEGKPQGYRNFWQADLDRGIPAELPRYNAIVSCEGIEHVANPGLLLRSAFEHLEPNGTVVVTTPNTWYPGARLQYFLRGFFPSFPSLVGRIEPGTHMHIMPWSWPHLYLHLRLAGFVDIELHPCLEEGRVHRFERFLAVPMRAYCRRRAAKSKSDEERRFWEAAAGDGSLLARRLVVSARKAP